MKRVFFGKLIVGMMVLFCATTVHGADATAGLDINSAYVWRGMTFNDGLVFQPSVDVTKGGFGLNVWGNIDAGDYDDTLETGKFSEVDITLSYGFDMEPVGVTIGYIEYLFPTTEMGGSEAARELFVSFGMDLVAGFSVGLDVYYEFELMEEFYTNIGLAYSAALNDKTTLDLGARMGYAGDEYCMDGDAGFFDYLLSAGIGYTVNESLTIAATMNYADTLDDDKLETDTNFFGGVSLAYGF